MNAQTASLTSRGRKGFTILEMVVAMSIIILMTGLGIMASRSGDDEAKLLEDAGHIEETFRRARNLAIVQQRPYVVELAPRGISLRPLGDEEGAINPRSRSLLRRQEVRDERRRGSLSRQEQDEALNSVDNREWKDVVLERNWSEEALVSVQRWGQRQLREIEENRDSQVFVMEPNGLVEPVTIRIDRDDDWMQFQLSPLTGATRDQEMVIN